MHRANLQKIHQTIRSNRLADTAPYLEKKDSENPKLQLLCKVLWLDYGRTHSAQLGIGGSYFIDEYTRSLDAKKVGQTHLLGNQVFVHHEAYGFGALVQDEPIMDCFSKKKEIRGFHRTTFKGRSTGFLTFSVNKDQEAALEGAKFLECYGLFQNKEMLLTVAADAPLKQFNANAECKNELMDFFQAAEYDPHKILNHYKSHCHDQRSLFYLGLLKDLLSNLGIPDDAESKQQFLAALRRLGFILKNALERQQHKFEFFVWIGYAFDEIILLKMLGKPYAAEEVSESLQTFYRTANCLDEKQTPALLLTSCGMHAGSNVIFAALDEMKEQKQFRIFIEKNAYFEFMRLFRNIFTGLGVIKKENEDVCISVDDSKSEVVKFDEGIVDIMLCSFEQNPSLSHPQYGSRDVEGAITRQLELRKALNKAKRLIVIIDMTASSFDTRLSFLMMMHEDAITAGTLAVVCIHSSKYLFAGLDKFPCAITSIFSHDAEFPELNKMKQRKNYFGGFELHDPTVQMLTHFVKFAVDAAVNFGHHLKDRARITHAHLTEQGIMPTQNQFLSVCQPYTEDLYHNSWSFLVLKLDGCVCKDAVEGVLSSIKSIFETVGIPHRIGFGYGYTTYLVIENKDLKLIRLSLGMESREELLQMIKPVIDYMRSINQAVEKARLIDSALDEIEAINQDVNKKDNPSSRRKP